MIDETNKEIQVQLDDIQESTESIELPVEDQDASADSGSEDELDKYTRGVSKRINKLNERVRMAEERAAQAETKYYSLQGEYATVKNKASVLDKVTRMNTKAVLNLKGNKQKTCIEKQERPTTLILS
jgi:hypothetical protein